MSSLVGRVPPGRGDAGGTGDSGAGRAEGPIEALMLVLGVPVPEPFPGVGEGLGLVDGGRKVAILPQKQLDGKRY